MSLDLISHGVKGEGLIQGQRGGNEARTRAALIFAERTLSASRRVN